MASTAITVSTLGLARFLHFEHFTALIVTAFWTSAVWLLAFVAVGALGRRGSGQVVVGAAARCARFGMPPFGIWHDKSPGDATTRLRRFFSESSIVLDQVLIRSVFQLLANLFESPPTRIGDRDRAMASFQVEVAAAMRAQSFASRSAHLLGGKPQQNLLLQHVFEMQSLTLIVANLGFRGTDRGILASGVHSLRTIEQVEAFREGIAHRLEAARATSLDFHAKGAQHANVLDHLAGLARFLHQFN